MIVGKFKWALACGLLCASAEARVHFEDRVIERTTSNGIKLLIVEKHDAPTVGIHMIYRVGSVDDPVGKGGLAHLFEHMMFKGSKTIGTSDYAKEVPLLNRDEEIHELLRRAEANSAKRQQLLSELSSVEQDESKLIVSNEFQKIYEKEGATQANAYTSADVTRYFVDIASQKLELWAILESDRLKHPVFRQFYSEVEVVKEEHRTRLEDNPENALGEALSANAFTRHPYGRPPLGTLQELNSVVVNDLRNFYADHYTPDHLIIAVVGDVHAEEVLSLVEHYFGDWRGASKKIQEPPAEPVQTAKRFAVLKRSGEPQIMIGFHMPAYPDPDEAAYFALFHLLGNGPRSILYERLVNEEKLAGRIKCTPFVPGERYPSLFVIHATVAPGHSAAELETAIMAELTRFSNAPIDPRQVRKVAPAVDLELSQTLLSNHDLASRLAYYEAVNGTWRSIIQFHDAITKLTAQDLQRVSRQLFVPANETVVTLQPELAAKP